MVLSSVIQESRYRDGEVRLLQNLEIVLHKNVFQQYKRARSLRASQQEYLMY